MEFAAGIDKGPVVGVRRLPVRPGRRHFRHRSQAYRQGPAPAAVDCSTFARRPANSTWPPSIRSAAVSEESSTKSVRFQNLDRPAMPTESMPDNQSTCLPQKRESMLRSLMKIGCGVSGLSPIPMRRACPRDMSVENFF